MRLGNGKNQVHIVGLENILIFIHTILEIDISQKGFEASQWTRRGSGELILVLQRYDWVF